MRKAIAIATLVSTFCISITNAELSGTVRIDVRFVAYPKAQINEIIAQDITKPLSVQTLNELLKKGTGKVLSAHSLVTESGHEAVVFDENIHRIPMNVDVEINPFKAESHAQAVAVAKPQDWEDVGAGMIISATPVISGNFVSLEFEAKLTEEPEFSPRKISCVHSETGEMNLTTEKAVYKIYSINSIATLENKETILISSGMTTKDNEDIYAFLTCTILKEPTEE